MTCFGTSTLEDSHLVSMPTFLRGVSVHPLYLTRHPVAFEEQFSDTTPFPQNTVVSLDFPFVTSVAATRFFDKCYATAALGRTVVLVGGFRVRPTNRRVRRALAQRAPGDSQDAMVLLTFPGRSFPAGAVRGWPESPDADEQEHPKFSMHICICALASPHNHRPWIHGKLTVMRTWRNTLAIPESSCFPLGRRVKPRPSHRNGYITSRRYYTGYLCHTDHAGIDSLSCGGSGRIHHYRCDSQTSHRLRF